MSSRYLKKGGVFCSLALSLLLARGAFAAPSMSKAPAYSLPVRVTGMSEYPQKANEFASAVVVDVASGKTLFAFHPNEKRSAASLTKLMSALVFLDRAPVWTKLVAMKSQDEVGGGRLRLNVGSTMTVKDVFYSAIVASANNSANAMARSTGLSKSAFVAQMNKKAAALGMKSSKFVEPTGMEPANVSTANDLALMVKEAFRKPAIREAALTKSYSFTVRNLKVVKTIKNTDVLLEKDPGFMVIGGKTGFLYESMYNFVLRAETGVIGDGKPGLVVVVLGAQTPEGAAASAEALAKWSWEAYRWPSPQRVAVTP